MHQPVHHPDEPITFKPHVTSSVLGRLPPVPKLKPRLDLEAPTHAFEFDNMTIRLRDGAILRAPAVQPLQIVKGAIKSMLIAGIILFVFNSYGFTTWANNLSTSRGAELVTGISQTWHDWMSSIGVAGMMEGARNHMADLRELTWQDLSAQASDVDELDDNTPQSESIGNADNSETARLD